MVEGSIGIRYPIYQTKLIKRQQYKLKEISMQDAFDNFILVLLRQYTFLKLL